MKGIIGSLVKDVIIVFMLLVFIGGLMHVFQISPFDLIDIVQDVYIYLTDSSQWGI